MEKDVGLRPLALSFFVSAACAACVALLPGRAVGGEVRAVVELFTSQGCSSCPPADRLLGELAKDSSIVTVTLPVDYWDYLGWKDTLANSRYSARQRAYARERGDREVATPQVIVNGVRAVVGSDRVAIERAIQATRNTAMIAPVSVAVDGDKLTVNVAAAENDQKGEVWLCAMTRAVPVTIGRGENTGRSITYHNVSRRWLKVGDWKGKAATWSIPLSDIKGEDVDAAAAIVQSGTSEKPGPMLGAAFASLR
ncbi:MAG: DUF1223 domain-containing protein [Pseudorhodoplanes sp.]|jgi:hypothetical protein|nr:DUF1223 domain-containing protein [Pseudorhodoplanes sp.]